MSSLISLILWTIVLIVDILNAVMGNSPNWVMVFCPLSMLILRCALDIFA